MGEKDYNQTADEHDVSIYFKMPRLWNSIFEVTLVDLSKERSRIFCKETGYDDNIKNRPKTRKERLS